MKVTSLCTVFSLPIIACQLSHINPSTIAAGAIVSRPSAPGVPEGTPTSIWLRRARAATVGTSSRDVLAFKSFRLWGRPSLWSSWEFVPHILGRFWAVDKVFWAPQSWSSPPCPSTQPCDFPIIFHGILLGSVGSVAFYWNSPIIFNPISPSHGATFQHCAGPSRTRQTVRWFLKTCWTSMVFPPLWDCGESRC